MWSLHDVLLSLDYASEDNKQIVDLLLQCFHRPIYIRNDDVSCLCVSSTVSVFCCGFVIELSA